MKGMTPMVKDWKVMTLAVALLLAGSAWTSTQAAGNYPHGGYGNHPGPWAYHRPYPRPHPYPYRYHRPYPYRAHYPGYYRHRPYYYYYPPLPPLPIPYYPGW
jgi:hypothetical protein